jgi:hypothetical protein
VRGEHLRAHHQGLREIIPVKPESLAVNISEEVGSVLPWLEQDIRVGVAKVL